MVQTRFGRKRTGGGSKPEEESVKKFKAGGDYSETDQGSGASGDKGSVDPDDNLLLSQFLKGGESTNTIGVDKGVKGIKVASSTAKEVPQTRLSGKRVVRPELKVHVVL
ncbi:uncharacterized protein LOC113347289 [Papaver somniferum]|uniref:uncharacterized protein LOC113347289 n=1 Tax=Papaver somniferum TaxID=3469 RepID=UPI000E6FBDF8|nr:uncharacterized protein LOC113347289 [Papaver somniferum]